MIVFNLVCSECEYPFEGWFDDTKSFNSQKKRKLINCPNCESSNVSKTLVAPNVSKKSNSKFPVRDIFNKVCCIGGFKEFTTEQEPNKANISMINALYSPDDGESIVSWKVAPSTNNPLTSNKNIDFFVVTGTINSTEIPISCHPFVNFNYEYKLARIIRIV